jgi:hypothetical protein
VKRRIRRHRDVLAANFRRSAIAARDSQALPADEIDRRIVDAILARVPQGGNLCVDDILRMDVPRGAITKDRVKRCIDRAREIDPAIATVEAFA